MRRSRTCRGEVDNTRVRKISLQNNYAFGIISPVTPATLPVSVPLHRGGNNDEALIPCILVRPWQVERRISTSYPADIDIAVDPLSESLGNSSSICSTSSDRFRRWSMSNFQSAFKAIEPSGTEASSQFTSDDEDLNSSRSNLFQTSFGHMLVAGADNENWISEFVTSLPERIRKISTEKKPNSSDTNIYSPDENLKKQMRKVYVY